MSKRTLLLLLSDKVFSIGYISIVTFSHILSLDNFLPFALTFSFLFIACYKHLKKFNLFNYAKTVSEKLITNVNCAIKYFLERSSWSKILFKLKLGVKTNLNLQYLIALE